MSFLFLAQAWPRFDLFHNSYTLKFFHIAITTEAHVIFFVCRWKLAKGQWQRLIFVLSNTSFLWPEVSVHYRLYAILVVFFVKSIWETPWHWQTVKGNDMPDPFSYWPQAIRAKLLQCEHIFTYHCFLVCGSCYYSYFHFYNWDVHIFVNRERYMRC